MKVKIAAVSYTNTIPFIYGLKHFMDANKFDLTLEYPSKCADDLIQDKVDLALVPVASLKQLSEYHLVSDYCIGANGLVDTVCIYSECPIEEVETLYLDYQSRSSVMLSKILLRDYWKLSPKFIHAQEGFIENIQGKTAGLVIGDRAFDLNAKFHYVYDLAELWKQHTKLPFVFAAWVSNKELDLGFISELNSALKKGLAHISEAIEELGSKVYSISMAEKYLNDRIDYHLDKTKKQGMDMYLNLIDTFQKAEIR